MSIWNFWNKEQVLEQRNETKVDENPQVNYGFSCFDMFDQRTQIELNSVAWGGISLIADAIAQLPWAVYNKSDDGARTPSDNNLNRLFKLKANSYQNKYTFAFKLVRNLVVFNETYVRVYWDSTGENVVALEVLDGDVNMIMPLNANPDFDTPTYEFDKYKTADGKKLTLKGKEVLHLVKYTQDGKAGVPLDKQFQNMFKKYNNISLAGESIAKNAAKPGGIVFHRLKGEELTKFIDGWRTKFSGVNAGETAFLEKEKFEYKELEASANAGDAKIEEQLAAISKRIAVDILRIPPHMVGLSDSPTYASVEQMAIEFNTYTLNPYITIIENAFNVILEDKEEYLKINSTALLRGDTNSRLTYYRGMLDMGVMTPNHIAAKEDLGHRVPADQGGDTYKQSVQFRPSETTTGSMATSGSAA